MPALSFLSTGGEAIQPSLVRLLFACEYKSLQHSQGRRRHRPLLEPMVTDIDAWFAELDRFTDVPFMEGREASIEDQLRLCRLHAEKQRWSIAESYHDRPGIQALLADALRGRFEVVLAEALDRISRDQEGCGARSRLPAC